MNKPSHVIQYNSDSSPDVVFDYLNNPDKDSNLWLRITSLKDTDFLMSVARHFGIHELSMEDVLNPKHQAKFEQESSYSLIILKRIQEVDSEI